MKTEIDADLIETYRRARSLSCQLIVDGWGRESLKVVGVRQQ